MNANSSTVTRIDRPNPADPMIAAMTGELRQVLERAVAEKMAEIPLARTLAELAEFAMCDKLPELLPHMVTESRWRGWVRNADKNGLAPALIQPGGGRLAMHLPSFLRWLITGSAAPGPQLHS